MKYPKAIRESQSNLKIAHSLIKLTGLHCEYRNHIYEPFVVILLDQQ